MGAPPNQAQAPDFRDRARPIAKGNRFEDFAIGRVFDHHWGRTINAGDNSLFTSLTLYYNPICFNASHAAAEGHPAIVVNPFLVFNTVFGLTVEDLSEGGGPFLGIDALTFHAPVYVGDTLTARSTVVDKRQSKGHPEMGIVTWHTEGTNQSGVLVVDYRRTNLVRRRT